MYLESAGGGTHISISHISIIWALYILYLPFWHHDRPTFERLNSSGSSGSEMDLGGRAQRAKILNSTSSYLISLFEMRPISYICDIRDMSAPPHVFRKGIRSTSIHEYRYTSRVPVVLLGES